MNDLIYERDYAREILFAAIRHQADANRPTDDESDHPEDITALIGQAVEAGCSRTELIVELANLGARLYAKSASDNRPAHARAIVNHIAC